MWFLQLTFKYLKFWLCFSQQKNSRQYKSCILGKKGSLVIAFTNIKLIPYRYLNESFLSVSFNTLMLKFDSQWWQIMQGVMGNDHRWRIPLISSRMTFSMLLMLSILNLETGKLRHGCWDNMWVFHCHTEHGILLSGTWRTAGWGCTRGGWTGCPTAWPRCGRRCSAARRWGSATPTGMEGLSTLGNPGTLCMRCNCSRVF